MWSLLVFLGLVANHFAVAQTTTCIPASTSTAAANNPFLLPNSDQYPYRAGQKSFISWKPTNSDTVSIILHPEVGYIATIAASIPNSGFFEWSPDSALINLSEPQDQGSAKPYRLQIDDGSQGSSDEFQSQLSPTLFVLSDSYPTWFVNVSSWSYPTVGESTTILWSPSNEASISIQLVFGAGAVPGPSNTIIIADKVPNTGSWTWDVPSDFKPGQYALSGLSSSTGKRDTTPIPIVVGKTPAVPCGSSASPSSSTTNQASTSSTTASPLAYEQILHLTTCSTSLQPSYTSIILSSTTTSFRTIDCPNPTVTSTSTPSCYPEYTTFSVNPTNSICCPSGWGTSSIGDMWCFTSTTSSSPGATASEDVSGRVPSQTAGTTEPVKVKRAQDGTQTETVVIRDFVFVKAGNATNASTEGGKENDADGLESSSWMIILGSVLVGVLGIAVVM